MIPTLLFRGPGCLPTAWDMASSSYYPTLSVERNLCNSGTAVANHIMSRFCNHGNGGVRTNKLSKLCSNHQVFVQFSITSPCQSTQQKAYLRWPTSAILPASISRSIFHSPLPVSIPFSILRCRFPFHFPFSILRCRSGFPFRVPVSSALL